MSDAPLQFDDSELDVAAVPSEKLADAVYHLDTLTTRIMETKKTLEQMQREKTALERDTLPAIMQEIGTNVFGIPDTDRECRIQGYYHATFPKDHIDEAVAWLDDHELGGVVTNTLTVNIPKGYGEEAKQIQQRVQQMLAEYEINAEAELKYGSHWKTYTAMVKEQHEKGLNLPLTLLNATIGQIATIKKRK